LFPGEEAAFAQDFFAEFVLQTIAENESGVWGEAYSELLDHFFVEAASGEVFSGSGAFGTAQTFLEKGYGAFVDIEQLAAKTGFFGLAFGGVSGFGQRDSEFLGYQAN